MEPEQIASAVADVIESDEMKRLSAMLGDNDLSSDEWRDLLYPILNYLELD